MSQRFQDAAILGLGQLYGITSNYSQKQNDNPTSKRKLAAATAASVLGASFDKWKDKGEERKRSGSSGSNGEDDSRDISGTFSDGATDDDTDGFWRDSDFEEDGEERSSTDIKREKTMDKTQSHFIDILLEKLLVHAVIPDKKDLEFRVNDPLRKEGESLSIPKFTKNLRKMTARLGGAFQAQYFILRIFHWTQPSLTITSLMIYTYVVLHPNLLFILPLIYLLYGIMVPGYLHRHPIHKPKLLKVRPRGESLLELFSKIDNPKMAEIVDEEKAIEEEEIEKRVPELNETIDSNVKLLKKNMEFIVNMRDLQNSLTNLLGGIDNIEKFWYGTAGFKDERISTSLFFTVFLTVCILVLIGPYIPWRIMMITNGWLLFILIHPKVYPKLMEFNNLIKPQKKDLDKIVKDSERRDIIIDDPPEIKEVEIFEIFQKSFTSSNWEFYMFSQNIFDMSDAYRKAQKPPPGVATIDSVQPPKGWKFEDDEPWNIDYECLEWCQNRGLRLNRDNFIDENNEFHIDDEFKRRRLFRNVIRYSRPARKPTHVL
ncbi:Peroxisomal membrane protein PEX28 [Wickerhamomyces ciferrii]|uniref:Peroxisomal membrane protein PEX28 n=1 Tax=Wickerhamomyces ciferrii (strain ATCC 14091 / BCRC 22168 / CBS 111 / JCM 3599 / NBRC 0793 / NRRL Y-1031 F-60-10) TaxID=1206466 RepID=K0K8H9_WICCF|nr:Peroxisomal membrane protein PEX28 [Wickerhamomyces ciferrii]CCH41150.1 Peroxisomal membrane protein PEX28 [Wickerhamomyces ciferrii]